MDKSFTKPMLRILREMINDSFKDGIDLGNHKFQLTLGNCSFDEDQAKFQLIVTFKGNSVQDIQRKKEFEDLKQMAHLFDIDLERKHPRYTLVGYKMKARSKPWIITDNQKKGEYIITDDQAKMLFGKQEKVQVNG
tara:strand:+ start:107 stop:514 length:408 start_codon:yes stop_codon:yes gene_type:complete